MLVSSGAMAGLQMVLPVAFNPHEMEQAFRGCRDFDVAAVSMSMAKENGMKYVEGFVCAVPAANKEAYLRHAQEAARMLKAFGVSRMVECWGDDVPDGKVTDFRQAVKATADEVVVFSWFEYPSKEVRESVMQKMMDDPRMKEMGDAMCFDGKRMIFGGFVPILDE